MFYSIIVLGVIKMMRIVFIGIICIMLSGCSVTNNIIVQKEVKESIIDACYTVLEYNPQDKEVRINKYLDSKEKKNDITPE